MNLLEAIESATSALPSLMTVGRPADAPRPTDIRPVSATQMDEPDMYAVVVGFLWGSDPTRTYQRVTVQGATRAVMRIEYMAGPG